MSKQPAIRTVALTVCLIVAAAGLVPPSAVAEPAEALLDDGFCASSLSRAQQFLGAHRTNLTLQEAIEILHEFAGLACGFEFRPGMMVALPLHEIHLPVPEDREPQCESRDDNCEKHENINIDVNLSHLDSLLAAGDEVVPCRVPGTGVGGIQVSILGVPLGTFPAEGSWTYDTTLTVSGEGGLFGGVQTEGPGTMLLTAAPLPSLDGTASAFCIKVETRTLVASKCWWLVIYTACTSEVRTSVDLIPCASESKQKLGGTTLLVYEHRYVSQTNPC